MCVQVFGGDSLLNLSAGQETLASQSQWVEDMDVEVQDFHHLLTMPCAARRLFAALDVSLSIEFLHKKPQLLCLSEEA